MFLFLACATPTTDPADRPTLEDVDQGQEPDGYALTDGERWEIVDRRIPVDPCGAEEYVTHGQVGTVVTLVDQGGGAFRLEGDSTDDCALDGWDYACDVRTDEDHTPAEYGLDAVILFDAELSGSIDASTMTMDADVFLRCDGPDCELVELIIGGSDCELALEMDLVPAD